MSTDRFPTNYLELKGEMEYLTAEDLLTFELKAKILSFEDVCVYLCLDIDSLSEKEMLFAKKAHARGQVDAIHTAAEKLFSHMSTRNGAVSALEYLRATSGLFQIDATPISASKGSGFSFTVNMNQSKPDKDSPDPEAAQTKTPALAEVT